VVADNASAGGGIRSSSGSVTLVDCTLVDNTTTGMGAFYPISGPFAL